MKSNSLNKLMKLNIISFSLIIGKTGFILLLLTLLTACGSPGVTKIDEDSYYQLEQDVSEIMNSSVADAAPLEMKFIKEKLQSAKKAKADKNRSLEAQIIEQIYADMKIANMRAELNQLNQELLNKRDQVSAAQLYLSEIKERLQ